MAVLRPLDDEFRRERVPRGPEERLERRGRRHPVVEAPADEEDGPVEARDRGPHVEVRRVEPESEAGDADQDRGEEARREARATDVMADRLVEGEEAAL